MIAFILYKQSVVLNNQQGLIVYKTQETQNCLFTYRSLATGQIVVHPVILWRKEIQECGWENIDEFQEV